MTLITILLAPWCVCVLLENLGTLNTRTHTHTHTPPHRKYSRLNVRYSRLQQTPVRFTFTPGGEMVEEEMSDYDDEDEDDMTNMKMKPN